MEDLKIAGNSVIPEIEFNPTSGNFLIAGNCVPNNSMGLFLPVLAWLNEYSLSPREKTTLNIQLNKFNTNSSKAILQIFRLLEKIYAAGKEVSINWLHGKDDEDMIEAGEDYKSLTRLPFNLIIK